MINALTIASKYTVKVHDVEDIRWRISTGYACISNTVAHVVGSDIVPTIIAAQEP